MTPSPEPRILAIVSSWPCGPTFGNQLRTFHVLKALSGIGSVSVIVATSDPIEVDAQAATAAAFRTLDPIQILPVPNRTLVSKARWALDSRFICVNGCSADESEVRRIETLARDSDLVWFAHSRIPGALRRWRWNRSHLDVDDIPSNFHRSTQHVSSGLAKRVLHRVLLSTLRRRESLFLDRFDSLSVCSEPDRAYLGASDRIFVIPNGFTAPEVEPVRSPTSEAPRIGFIGLYDYLPNSNGIEWFLQHCWKTVRQAIPGVRLRLVGKGTNGPNSPKEESVEGLGYVDNPGAEIATWSSMIIPIRLGGGTRIKLAEAFSRKCPVVSTSLGAFGYSVKDGEELRLTDSPDAFAKACIDSIRTPDVASRMAERAYRRFLAEWTWDAIAPCVHRAARYVLQKSQGQRR